ncbi:MAG: dolichyl-phosphate beta-glucosyltransferase [Promethearchaeota archaeon]
MEGIIISILIPAYNEEKRISHFLNTLINFLSENLNHYEIIIINDGSSDKTEQIAQKIQKDKPFIKLINYKKNMGKGFAISRGVLKARGKFIVFMDADGSTPATEILNILNKFQQNNFDIIIGSRIKQSSKIKIPQPLSRRLLSKVFNLYSNFLFRIKINDLLCGFKGFKREVAVILFKNLKSFRWEFDVEILYNARKHKYMIYELPIEWKHEEGSKIKILDPILILINLFKLRLKYL